ncbi:hypothetical protein NDU88_006187 [Pleurodeles waltl]|uniref:Uncharacterized protein n=1 Tax=Pleurodeles waltl TaxID=8319 RepID=A0AAV7NTG2_PLEWA|nr:hypothetical protein NDU88_006187 [Pleurodeles waltl]
MWDLRGGRGRAGEKTQDLRERRGRAREETCDPIKRSKDTGPEREEGTRRKENAGPEREERTRRKENAGPETKAKEEPIKVEPKDGGGRLLEEAWGAKGGSVRTRQPCHVPGGAWLNKVRSLCYQTVSYKKMREGSEETVGENTPYV